METMIELYQRPQDIPTPLTCAPLTPMQKNLFSRFWWSRDYPGRPCATPDEDELIESHRELIRKILAFGGGEVMLAFPEEDLDELKSRGVFLYGHSASLRRMRASACHWNAAALWRQSPAKYIIMTGYALSLDGLWRQHSWCIDRESGNPVETTTLRLAYFGFLLNDQEADAFSQSHSHYASSEK